MARGGYRQKQAKYALSQLDGQARSAVTDPVAQSARKLLQGKGWTQADLDRVVAFNGGNKGRSAATSVQRAQRSFSQTAQRTQNYITAFSQLTTQGTSSAGRANITLQITKDIEQALKTKLVKSVALSVSKYLGENPSASRLFLRSLGAGLRIGGAIATVALLGVEAAENVFESRRRVARAQINSFNTKRSLGIDARQTKGTESVIDLITAQSASFYDQLGNEFGTSSEVKEAAEKSKQDYFKSIAKGRGRLSELGINENRALVEGARKLGKNVQDLSEEERQSILDDALLQVYGVVRGSKQVTLRNSDTASVGRTATATEILLNGRYANDQRVKERLNAEGIGTGNTAYTALFVKYAIENAAGDLNTALNVVDKLAETAATIRARRTGLETWRAQEEIKKGVAEFSSYRARQRPYITN